MIIDSRRNALSYDNAPKDIDLNVLGFTLARLKSSRGSGDVITAAYTLVGIPYWFIEGLIAAFLFRRIRLLGRTQQSGFEVSIANRNSQTISPQKDESGFS